MGSKQDYTDALERVHRTRNNLEDAIGNLDVAARAYAGEGTPEPPPSGFYREFPDYTVTEAEPARVHMLKKSDGIYGTWKRIEWGYRIDYWVWPRKSNSVIGSNVKMIGTGQHHVFGQEVLKVDDRLNVVWNIHKEKRPAGPKSMNEGLRFTDGVGVTHVYDAPASVTYVDLFNIGGQTIWGKTPTLSEIVIDHRLEFRLSQVENHPLPEEGEGWFQERPPIGAEYTKIWLRLS